MKTVKTFLLSCCVCFCFLFGLSFGAAAEEPRDVEAFSAPVMMEDGVIPLVSGLTCQGPFPIWNETTQTTESLTYTVPSTVLSNGIDVSKWQGNIDWKKVKASGVDFAFIRVGNRSTSSTTIMEDPYFHQNMVGAQAAGVKVGVYIFSQAISVEEAEEEAAFVLRHVKNYKLDLPIVFDYEFSGNGRLVTAYNNGTLNRTRGTDVCVAFCNYISKFGYSPMVYANASMLTVSLDADRIEKAGDIWLANYTTATSYQNDYQFWQYSDRGRINGISGNVDCNFCFVQKTYKSGGNFFPFIDVKPEDWFYEQVKYTSDNDLFYGTKWNEFSPYGTMTRAMLVSVLYRMDGSPTVSGNSSFKDLTADWYKDAVIWGEKTKVVSGTSPTSFEPDKALSRQEMVTFLQRYAMYKKYDVFATSDLNRFPDGSETAFWAIPSMKWAVASGYVRGYNDGTLLPAKETNRAEVATVLKAFCEDNNLY